MSSTFESSIKVIPYSQQKVYNNISDLNNLEKVKDRIPQDKVKNFIFDHDSVSISVSPVGDIKIHIIERDEPKCIKFETEKSPVPFFLWIQIVPESDDSCKIKLTLKAELNPFIKGMVSGPLKDGLEKVAEALAQVHYE
ncbi:polyketide cyclase [Xylanibacter oryzae]|uniref:polyketide cyclase n=1 Tax=Xylanibacter oryzae TaxID=185293 RepID=UPI0004B8BE52|nr:polyketide cyclase [Xylanibacter oryzae]MBP7358214.1 SRPBCC family protein [Prevotella sp.]